MTHQRPCVVTSVSPSMPSFLHTPDDTQQNVGDHDCTKLQQSAWHTNMCRVKTRVQGNGRQVTHARAWCVPFHLCKERCNKPN